MGKGGRRSVNRRGSRTSRGGPPVPVSRGAVHLRGPWPRGQRLVGWLALPAAARPEHPAPVVVAMHGCGAKGSTLSPMVAPLVRAGVATVVLFDATNHGDSSGEAFSALPRFAEDLPCVLGRLATEPPLDAGRAKAACAPSSACRPSCPCARCWNAGWTSTA